MALFKTIEEIKDFLPVSVTFSFQDILPFIKQAERDYIIPAIGKEQYEEIDEAYNAETPDLDEEQEALLEKIRVPLASFAYMLWIPWGQVQIDSSGIRIVTNENIKTAFQWQVNALEESAMSSGYSGLEALLEFLEEGKDTYTTWADSDAYTEYKKHFIYSAKIFNQYFNIGSNRRTYMALSAIMNRIEETLIKNTIGVESYNEIKQQVKDNAVSEENQELLDLINPTVANLTIARGISQLSLRINNNGIIVLMGINPEKIYRPADKDLLSDMKMQANQDGQNFLKQLEELVNEDDEDYDGGGFENDPDWNVGMFD